MELKESIFWNLMRILWKRKKFFTISLLSTAIIVFIITSLMPKTYKGTLTFIVNEDDQGFNIGSSLLNDLPLNFEGFAAINVDKYLALIESRRIRDVLIKEFDLWDEYDEDYIEFVYKELSQNIEIIDNFDGTVTVNCYFKRYPEKAAQMAQKIYDELYILSRELRQEKSRHYREFLEDNLNETLSNLHRLEDSLKAFQIEHKIIKFNEQAEFSFEALAELEAQYMQYNIEYKLLKNTVSSNNPKFKVMEERLKAIQESKELLYKEGEDYIIAFNKMPEYGLTYFRILRDVSIQQEILKILLPIVQNARIEENKQTVNIQIVDPPFIPQYKAKPKRLVYMIIITMLLGIFEVLFFAVYDAYKKNRQEIHDWILKDDK